MESDFTKPSLKYRLLNVLSKFSRIILGRSLSDRLMILISPTWFIENELSEILSKEIKKEINAEIIRKINIAAKEGK